MVTKTELDLRLATRQRRLRVLDDSLHDTAYDINRKKLVNYINSHPTSVFRQDHFDLKSHKDLNRMHASTYQNSQAFRGKVPSGRGIDSYVSTNARPSYRRQTPLVNKSLPVYDHNGSDWDNNSMNLGTRAPPHLLEKMYLHVINRQKPQMSSVYAASQKNRFSDQAEDLDGNLAARLYAYSDPLSRSFRNTGTEDPYNIGWIDTAHFS